MAHVHHVLTRKGLVTWLDPESISSSIDRYPIDAVAHTECMLVFVTENYVRKLEGDPIDYWKREFAYALENLGKDRTIFVVSTRQ